MSIGLPVCPCVCNIPLIAFHCIYCSSIISQYYPGSIGGCLCVDFVERTKALCAQTLCVDKAFVHTKTWWSAQRMRGEDSTWYTAYVGPIEHLYRMFCGTGPTKPLRTVFMRPAKHLYKVFVCFSKCLWYTWVLLSMQTIFASPLVN